MSQASHARGRSHARSPARILAVFGGSNGGATMTGGGGFDASPDKKAWMLIAELSTRDGTDKRLAVGCWSADTLSRSKHCHRRSHRRQTFACSIEGGAANNSIAPVLSHGCPSPRKPHNALCCNGERELSVRETDRVHRHRCGSSIDRYRPRRMSAAMGGDGGKCCGVLIACAVFVVVWNTSGRPVSSEAPSIMACWGRFRLRRQGRSYFQGNRMFRAGSFHCLLRLLERVLGRHQKTFIH